MRELNPLWRIYIFIVITSLATASAMIYVEWHETKSSARTDLKYANHIFTHALESLLHRNELLLDILGNRLVELNPSKRPIKANKLINELLNKSPELAGFGLANPDGQLFLTSFNIDRSRLPNLLKSSKTADSFKQALVSDSMVMGRTYYMKALKQWVIPMRYAIKNDKGDVVAVMATGLKFDTTKSIWSNKNLPKDMETIIIRKDLYPQYISNIKKSDYEKLYNSPAEKQDFNFLPQSNLGNKSSQHNHLNGNHFHDLHENKIISNVSYNKKYSFYTFIYIPLKTLYKKLALPVTWLTILLVFFNFALYLVFRTSIATNAKSKRDMQAMFDHSPTVIFIRDTNGCFIFVNHKFEVLHHVKREDIISKYPDDIFDNHIAKRMTYNDTSILQDGDSFEYEEDFLINNEVCSYVSTKFPLYDNKGNIYAIAGISTDVTERKQQEEVLRNSQKMEAMGKLTGGISHDYNNMLGVILGYSELLKDSLHGDAEKYSFVEEIERAAQRGAKLTKKLLSFTRNKSADDAVVDINSLLHDEKDMLEKTLTARIILRYDLDDELWPVLIDSNDLEDAILNITINAMHAIKEHGELTVLTQNQNVSKANAKHIGIKEGDYSIIAITDTGCGMDNKTLKNIFDPFYSTKGTKGTGLGLSQVYGFTERSGGKVTVTSEVGCGSQFKFYFPRHVGEIKPVEEQIPDEILEGNETILIVDDEPAILKITSESLSSKGYSVFCANNGKEALKILKEKDIDLMLSDVVMPKMDGFKLASLVKEKYPSIKIQLASGYSGDYDANLEDEMLKQNILDKPFTQFVLLKRIRDLLDNNIY